MAKTHRFFSHHTHEFLRVGACTPVASVGDIAANVRETIELAKRGHKEACDLLVYPELNLTSYAIDDLHLQQTIQRATEAALAEVAAATAKLRSVLLVGAAIPRNGRLYNCAVAIHRGRILGIVPKTFLPNYREYYEKRWFASGEGVVGAEIDIAGQAGVPFGTDLIFAASDLSHFIFHAEICEDYWAPVPPSTWAALAGALVCCNLSASNVLIGKERQRMLLSGAQSDRAVCAYVFSAAGPGESTTDLAWDGQGMVHELGELIAEFEALSGCIGFVGRRCRLRTCPARTDAQQHLRRRRPLCRGRRRGLPLHPLRGEARFRRCRFEARCAALSVRAQRAREARRRLL